MTAPAYIDIVLTAPLNHIQIFSSIISRLHGFLRANPTIKMGIVFPQFTPGAPNPTDRMLMQQSWAKVGPLLRIFAKNEQDLVLMQTAIDLQDLQKRSMAYISRPHTAPDSATSVSTTRTRFTFHDTSWTAVADKATRKAAARKELNERTHLNAYLTFQHDTQSYTLDFTSNTTPSTSAPNFDNLNSYGLSTPSTPCFFPSF